MELTFVEASLFAITGITLFGNYLISEGKKWGFLIGLISNVVLFSYDLMQGIPSHALLFLVNAILSWNGWRRLKNKPV